MDDVGAALREPITIWARGRGGCEVRTSARAADNAMMWGGSMYMRVMVCCLACRLPIFQGHRGATGGPVRGGKRENEKEGRRWANSAPQ